MHEQETDARSRTRWFGRAAALAACLLVPATALAQGETGAIAGAVRDSTGLALPGVTVEASSPALIEKVRTVATDGEGRYQLINLRPGDYTVSFELPGFNRVIREGVTLTAAFTATVNAEMRVGGVEESVTVVGSSPVVDVKGVVQQRTVSREVIDALPTSKTFGALASLIPGVTVNRPDVGGSAGDLSTSLAFEPDSPRGRQHLQGRLLRGVYELALQQRQRQA